MILNGRAPSQVSIYDTYMHMHMNMHNSYGDHS